MVCVKHLFAGHLTILEPKFDAVRTWEITEREGVQLLFMTGDAMARPLIEEFERQAATGRPYETSSLIAISSTAAIFSPEVKGRWDKMLNAVQVRTPNPALEFLLDACRSSDGCGVQVAHSGTVAGVIFDPRRPRADASAERCADRLEKAGLELTGVICVRDQAVIPGNPEPSRVEIRLPG